MLHNQNGWKIDFKELLLMLKNQLKINFILNVWLILDFRFNFYMCFIFNIIPLVFKIISISILFLIQLFNCSIFNIFLLNLILKQHWKWNYKKNWAFLKKLINQQKVIKFFKKFTAFFPSSSTNTNIRFFLCCDERKKLGLHLLSINFTLFENRF